MITYNKNIAIFLIVLNRPNTARQIFEQIKKIKFYQLYIPADGPRHESEFL